MLRCFAVLSVFLGAAACATTTGPIAEPKTISAATSGPTATIFLNRADVTVYSASDANVLLNGERIGTISNGQCARLTIPAGNHNLSLSAGLFSGIGSAIGSALASSLNIYNVKAVKGQRMFYFAKPVYDGPNTGWLFKVKQQPSGRAC